MTGPTTTGSIDAKLTIDKSVWDRNKDEAKAEAAELGALSPEIKVDANVGPALAKLEAVAKAERDLESSYMRSAIAQQKLDIATEKHGEDSLQAAQARLTLKRATDAESDAEAKLAASKSRTVVEQEKETESAERAINARRRHISGMQVLLALTPAIVAAAAPVAGAAVGLGAAFGIMAVSGVIAIKGINDEMKKGTDTGDRYAAGLGSLKTNLDSLGSTAATRMLGAFSTTVGDIDARMPAFTLAVGDGAAALGNMGGMALRNTLDGLGAMQPLLEGGAVHLGKFVGWLTSFAQAQGFQDFVAYSVTNLPNVMSMLEKLVTLGGNILAAFAPLGPVVLGLISGLADGLNSVPLPVLAGIVTSAVLIGPALSTAFSPGVSALIVSVAQGIGLTGVMANLAVPVVGILTAVVAGLGIAAATAALGTDQGAASLSNYTEALKEDSEAMGEHVRASAAKALADADAFNSARELGISQKTLTDAVLGSKDAIELVNEAVRKGREFQNDWSQGTVDANSGMYIATAAQDSMGKAIDNVTKQVDGQTQAIAAAKQHNEDLAEATKSTTGAMTDQARAQQLNANQYGTSVATYQAAESAQDKAKESTDKQTAAMQLQNDAAGLLKQAWDLLNGTNLSLEQAQTRSAAATNSVTKSFQKNGVAIQGTTEAAVANQQALQNKAAADQQAADAAAKAKGSTEAGTAAYAASKKALEDSMRSQGLLTADVQKYIDKLYNINNLKVKPTKLDIDKAEAELKLHGFQSAINALTGKTVHIYSLEHIQQLRESGQTGRANSETTANQYATGNAYRSGGGPIYRSGGGPVNYLAGGGSPFPGEPRGADVVPAWLEPGEEVLKRTSAQSLRRNNPGALEYMNSTGKLPAAATSGSTVNLNLTVNGTTAPREVADIVIAEVKWELQKEGVRLGG